MKNYKFLKFNQYLSNGQSDTLYLFAAKAKDLAAWAGIPRKGWQIRMLFQRPISPVRDIELKTFWDHASQEQEGGGFILGPTAIIVAIQDEINMQGDYIDLTYNCPVDLLGDSQADVIKELADRLYSKVIARLSSAQTDALNERNGKEFSDFPDVESDYVYEFALQLQQMRTDPERFIENNEIDQAGIIEIIKSMEAVLRPAIVVDGQHRLHGASSAKRDIILPVVAIPNCNWTEQIYQFVVINEKAQKVDTSLLSDIFGSSLTASERESIREKLSRSKVEIDARIASVIANRELESPFKDMIIVKMDGKTPSNISPFITDRTIRALIDGTSQKHSLGWRNDLEFFESYIKPTFSDRSEWDSWASGQWMHYWFAFWSEVRDFYNRDARSEDELLWRSTKQTNLTKAVTLRQLQSLFMRFCVDSIRKIEESREVLLDILGDHEQVDQEIQKKLKRAAIPDKVEDFKSYVREEFLEKGVEPKVFQAAWKASLDDPQGQDELWETLSMAFDQARRGGTLVIRGRIFVPREEKRESR